ncbi:MAG: single-stranded DNA-binding protein [Candidatus Limivicinus sp.]|jgi:single-strand DNA-binding protein
MDMISSSSNYTKLCGTMAAAPVYSHSSRGQQFYTFPLEILRLSGNSDTVNVIVRPEMLSQVEAEEYSRICVTGQVRTFNNRRGEGAKLVISIFAKELCLCDEEDCNIVQLRGTLCKEPKLRSTPMGRDICDLMLAVNRRYGRSDYLPCICWGARARQAAFWTVGTQLALEGRIQSRKYIKLTDEGAVEKTAYEISVTEAEEINGDEE